MLVGFLVSFRHDPLGIFFPLYGGPNRVGRQGAGDAPIALADPTTSTRHATIHCDPATGRIVVEDTGSTNGTWVNEVKLPCPGHCELKDGDYVRFGSYVLRVQLARRD